jgi:hypothetical protein
MQKGKNREYILILGIAVDLLHGLLGLMISIAIQKERTG